MKYIVFVALGLAVLLGTEIQAQAADTFTYAGFVTARVVYSQDKMVMKKIEAEGEEYDMILGDSWEFGKPCLPSKKIRVALPEGMTITHIEILQAEPETLPGSFYLYPAQPPRAPCIPTPPPPEFVKPDPEIYNSSEPYPGIFLESRGERYSECGQRLAFLHVYPLQYIPAERLLLLYQLIEFRIYYGPGGESVNPADFPLNEREREECEKRLKRWVINPEDVYVPLRPPPDRSLQLSPDTIDYVIITSSGLKNSFNDLLYWKKKKGITDTLVTTESIYSQYSRPDNQEKIRNFIVDAYNTWTIRRLTRGIIFR